MRSADEYRADLEADLSERYLELNVISIAVANSSNENDQDRLRRALVLLTYAHLEGFCKFALITYASAINASNLKCSQVTAAIAASSMSGIFGALRDKQKKHPTFTGSDSNDLDVHLLNRERVFISNFPSILETRANISDSVIDAGSNLRPEVLKRLLFCLDLNIEIVAGISGSLNRLLGVRNAIAHGDRLKKPKDEEVDEYIKTAKRVCEFILEEIFTSIKDQRFKS